jgi:hypothetical protein
MGFRRIARMDRRSALLVAWASLVTACGGGGSDASTSALVSTGAAPAPAPSPAPAPAPAPAPNLSANIIAWGDSLTGPFAANLGILYTDRQVVSESFVGQTSTTIANNQSQDTSHLNWINVFWYGQNNPSDPATIKADIARSIAHLAPGNNHFVVLDVVNKAIPEEEKGGAVYAMIVQLNAELAALYPNNFIDIRGILVAHADPSNPGDLQDQQMDVVPRSLRFDDIHLDNDGSVIVAQRVAQFIAAKGW